MTITELRDGTALLGFEQALSDLDNTADSAFWHAANRAMWTVAKLRPKTALLRLYHNPEQNLLCQSDYVHKGGVALNLSAFGSKAYSCYVTGTGSCIISDGENKRTVQWSGVGENGHRLYGLLSGKEASLGFCGDFTYKISRAAMWDGRISDEYKDIPSDPDAVCYDMTTLCEGFLIFDDIPFCRQEDSRICRIENEKMLIIPRRAVGVYEIRYRTAHKPISCDSTGDTKIPLDEDLCQILPMLIASYLCLDSAPDKSSYYYKMFCEQFGMIAASKKNHAYASVISNNNW